MEFNLAYFVKTMIEAGRYNPSLINPCSSLAVSYGNSILKAARQHRFAEVANLKLEVDDLDGFQYFYVEGKEVSASRWQEELLALLTKAFDKASK